MKRIYQEFPTLIQLAITFNIACVAVSSIEKVHKFLINLIINSDLIKTEMEDLARKIKFEHDSLTTISPITLGNNDTTELLNDAIYEYKNIIAQHTGTISEDFDIEINKTISNKYIILFCFFWALWGVVALFLIALSKHYNIAHNFSIHFSVSTFVVLFIGLILLIINKYFNLKIFNIKTLPSFCNGPISLLTIISILSFILLIIQYTSWNKILINTSLVGLFWLDLFTAIIPFSSFFIYYLKIKLVSSKEILGYKEQKMEVLKSAHDAALKKKKLIDAIQEADSLINGFYPKNRPTNSNDKQSVDISGIL